MNEPNVDKERISRLRREFITIFATHMIKQQSNYITSHIETITSCVDVLSSVIASHLYVLEGDHEKLFEYVKTINERIMQLSQGFHKDLIEKAFKDRKI